MTNYDYSCKEYSSYIFDLLSDALEEANLTDTTQIIHVHRKEDAEQLMKMLEIISFISLTAYLVEVIYMEIN
jgi:hypothetical protein